MKVFVDTNVIVSSFAFAGITRELVAELLKKHEIAISPDVIREVRATLITKLYHNPLIVQEFVDRLSRIAVVIEPPYKKQVSVRDKDDIPILAAAVESGASVLVTGDKDLLEVPNPPIRIMRPRELFDHLSAQ